MVVFSNFLVVYFGLNYSSLFCVILVSSRRRIYRVRDKNLATLLDPIAKEKDDMKISFVLTYYPALHKVYDILRKKDPITCTQWA